MSSIVGDVIIFVFKVIWGGGFAFHAIYTMWGIHWQTKCARALADYYQRRYEKVCAEIDDAKAAELRSEWWKV
jgi:hypothetical protein